ncbi:PAS domain S-box protein [Paracoccus liaowanqingii]|uniref:histidine kinase n=1 Tax=Paracoccus liaowanqingii TaxID=2560053 RepID=A0A4Z1BMA0_9RHOB|nr:HWE histidine kinase domain-containing protein [Paracoccus liaowanqingii]TGN62333.1 PAS domain S-box protein [Paracoccus liaowanqingii]
MTAAEASEDPENRLEAGSKSGYFSSQLTRDQRVVVAIGLSVWIAIGALLTLIARDDWKALMASVHSTSTTVSGLLAEQSDGLLVTADLVRKQAQRVLGTSGPLNVDRAAYDDLRSLIDISPTIASIWVGDAEGQAVLTTREFPAPDLSGASRDYYLTVRDDPDRLYVGNLLVNQYAAEALLINTSRRLSNPDGSMRGFVQVSLDPASIGQTFQQVDLGFDASLWWIGPDGRALIREPAIPADELDERTPPGSESWPQNGPEARADGTTRVQTPIMGMSEGNRKRLYFWSDSPLYGSRMIVGVSYDAMVARWTASIAWTVAFGVAIGLASMVILSLLYRARQKGLAYAALLESDVATRTVELAESEARLKLAIEAGQLAVWEVDVETDTVIGSPELNRLYGFPEDSTPNLDEFRSRYAPGELVRVREESSKRIAQGDTNLESEIRHIWPNGTEKWLLMRAQVGRNSTNTGTRVVGVVADITRVKQQEARIATVASELRHRLMNTITVISALARLSWPKNSSDEKDEFLTRLRAIGKAIDLMFSAGSDPERATLRHLLSEITDPYKSAGHNPFNFEGPDDVTVTEHMRPLAMAFHELCTNALKYGALSVIEGEVSVRWSYKADSSLHIVWQEMHGPVVSAPERSGLGSSLLKDLLFSRPNSVSIEYRPDGVICTIEIRNASG